MPDSRGTSGQSDTTTPCNPQVSMVGANRAASYGAGLLDGGATHAPGAASPEEWEKGEEHQTLNPKP